MRRTRLPAAVVLVVGLTVVVTAAPSPSAGADAARPAPAGGPPRGSATPSAPATPTTPSAADLAHQATMTELVPALQQQFGARFGGWWVGGAGGPPVMHVAVVAAGEPDRAAVARIAGGRVAVATESVTLGYDDLTAAAEEVTASLAPIGGHFAVGVDVAGSAVVVQTASDGRAEAGVARAAVRRAAARGVPPAAPATPSAAMVPGMPAAPAAPARPGPAGAAADPAAAVVIEPRAAIAIDVAGPGVPVGSSRNSFPPYEAGLAVKVVVGRTIFGCTSGLLFRNGFGVFGSAAGHCGPLGSGVIVGPRIVDSIRFNGYYGRNPVYADAGLYSLSAGRWSARAVVHGQGGHRAVTGVLSNAQIAVGLRLCFEGVTSNGANCGTVVRANQSLCCDAHGKTYVYSCINFAGRPGDSGGPVYQVVGTAARAAGMLSSTVTVNGAALMCFSTAQNLQARLGRIVLYR